MKGSRYHELFAKIDTDASMDERIIKSLQGYQPDHESIHMPGIEPKTNKTHPIHEIRRRETVQKYSVLRQALPSLAFLILIAVSVYGLVMGVYRNSKDMNNELSVASEVPSEASESPTDEISDINTVKDASNLPEPDTFNDEKEPDGSMTNDITAESSSPDNTADGTADTTDTRSNDTSDDEHYVVTDNSAEAVNIFSDYYKHDSFSEDLKILMRYHDASKVENLFIQSLGDIGSANYTVEDNMITIRKEYLDTLPEGVYRLDIIMDRGNPAFAQFAVHPEEEISEYGYYRLSHYYWDYYISDPKDFTFLVFNRTDARITGLRNGSIIIDPRYYTLDENGFVATLKQDYMADMQEGIRFDLVVEFNNGMEKTIGIKIREKEVTGPLLNSNFNVFEKSKPADVKIQIIWNDAKYISSIDPETHDSIRLSSDDYVLENDILTIKKEFLGTLPAGEYTWYLMFDIEIGTDIRIRVND